MDSRHDNSGMRTAVQHTGYPVTAACRRYGVRVRPVSATQPDDKLAYILSTLIAIRTSLSNQRTTSDKQQRQNFTSQWIGRRRRFRIGTKLGLEAHPLCSILNRRGRSPIKLAYSPSRPDGRLKLTIFLTILTIF